MLFLSKLIPNNFVFFKKQFIFAPYKIGKMNSGFQEKSGKRAVPTGVEGFILSSFFMCMR